MQEVKIDRLFSAGRGLMFYPMEKVNAAVSTSLYRTPTAEQLYALERLAREERARAVAACVTSGAAAVKSFYARAIATLTVVRHA